jgi:hypothetical protein
MNRIKIYDGAGNLKELITEEKASALFWSSRDAAVTPTKTDKLRHADPLPPQLCKRCNVSYIPSRANNNFCSRKCQKQDYRDVRAVPAITIKCRRCEKTFLGTKSRKYCNDPCSYYVLEDGSQRWRKYNV